MKIALFAASLALAAASFTGVSTAHACGGYGQFVVSPEQQIQTVIAGRFFSTGDEVQTRILSLGENEATARVALRRGSVERIRRLHLVRDEGGRWNVTRDRLIVVRSLPFAA